MDQTTVGVALFLFVVTGTLVWGALARESLGLDRLDWPRRIFYGQILGLLVLGSLFTIQGHMLPGFTGPAMATFFGTALALGWLRLKRVPSAGTGWADCHRALM
ncbi:MAG: hypothetical protein ABI743_09325, partial [bacterium]